MKRPSLNSSDTDGPRKRNRDNEETLRLLIPSKVEFDSGMPSSKVYD